MKNALIIGYGKSGQSAAKFLASINYQITVLDDHYHQEIPYKKITYRQLKKDLLLFDIGVRSPGVKSTSALYKMCQMLCIELISEIELGYRYLSNKNVTFIAVTGTNGKTTLVNMIYELIKPIFNNTHLLGNIGQPLTDNIAEIRNNAIIVLEISSFQLEDIKSFHPRICVITNIAKNHLDHVISYDFYKASKKRLLQNLTKRDVLFYTDESKELISKDLSVQAFNVTEKKAPFYLENDGIFFKKQIIIKFDELLIKGSHNLKHIITALNITYRLLGYSSHFKDVLKQFKGVDYRMQEIGTKGQYFIINDGKSTNVMSTQATLNTYNDLPRIILLGGIAKSGTFSSLRLKNDDNVCIYGKDAKSIASELKRGQIYQNIEEILHNLPQDGIKRYLIFSPGCASFDQFDNYIHRSEYFNELVEVLDNV